MKGIVRLIAGAVLMLGGCAAESNGTSAATRPAFLSVPAEQANPEYWFKQPATASVESADFYKLWNACENAAVWRQFSIDREDYREGVLSTYPMISQQFFEVWRRDAGTVKDVAWDSLQTIRRTVRFDFARRADGMYVVYPRVVMEKSAHPERRITAQAQYQQAFVAVGETPTVTNGEGATVATRYWYALGRDEAMEKELADSVRRRLGK